MAGNPADSVGGVSVWKMLCPRNLLGVPGFTDLESRDLAITAQASLFPGTAMHAVTLKGPLDEVTYAFVEMANRVLKVR